MAEKINPHLLEDYINRFKSVKNLADKALAQLQPEEYHWSPGEESNNISITMKHLAGNMISRWTDFLTADGEKPDRNRDSEFIDEFQSHEELIGYWEKGWNCCLNALGDLREDDLEKTVYIRQEPHSVIEAINRQLSHYSYHVGQIVYIARMIKKQEWKSLSIPKGKSEEFNRK